MEAVAFAKLSASCIRTFEGGVIGFRLFADYELDPKMPTGYIIHPEDGSGECLRLAYLQAGSQRATALQCILEPLKSPRLFPPACFSSPCLILSLPRAFILPFFKFSVCWPHRYWRIHIAIPRRRLLLLFFFHMLHSRHCPPSALVAILFLFSTCRRIHSLSAVVFAHRLVAHRRSFFVPTCLRSLSAVVLVPSILVAQY